MKRTKFLALFVTVLLLISFVISAEQPDIKDDLYENVNYEWLTKTILPANTSYYDDDIAMNPFISVLKSYASNPSALNPNSEIGKAVNTYISLQDYTSRNALGITPIYGYLQQIDAMNSLEDFANLCASLTKSGFNVLNIRYLAKNNKPTIKLMDFYLDMYYTSSYNSNYEAYLKKLFSLIDASSAHTITDSVIGLERALAKHSDANHYNEIKGADFQRLMAISKENNFSEIFKSAFVNQLGIKSNVKFSLKKDLVCQLQIIRTTDIPLLKNFLKSCVLRNCAGLLTQDIESSWAAHKNYSGLTKDSLYTKILMSSIGFCRLYGIGLVENISSKDKIFANDVFDAVKNQYITDIGNLKLQSESKIKKYLNNIKISYGVPIDMQAGVPFPSISKNSLINNILSLNAFNTAVCVSKSNKGQLFNYVQEKTYILANVDPNMAYDSITHSVIFCPLIFNSSRYNSSLSQNKKWLGMAFTIGHEIGHSIDSRNVPNLAKLYNLPSSDVEILSSVFQPISNQISTYSINISNKTYNMNPTRVLFEAVADYYGVKIVIEIIIQQKKDVSIEEFCATYAQMRRSIATDLKIIDILTKEFHPTDKFRVNGTLSNFEEVCKTYNIGNTNGMYILPEKRATVGK